MRYNVIFPILACLYFPATALSAEHGILPWPKNAIEMKHEDYDQALRMVHDVTPGTTLMSLWGWERLEPSKKESKLKQEIQGLNYAIINYGFKPYCGLTVIDTVKRVMPEDLNDKDWDDPELIVRYGYVLDELAKEIAVSPDYFIIANEADVYLEKNNEELEPFLRFATSAKSAIRQRFPKAAIGISVTYEGLQSSGERHDIAKKLMALSDDAFITYYPVIDLKPTPPKDTPSQLDNIIHEAGGKRVILQELGYPSALAGSSPQQQADFFGTIIPAIEARPQISMTGIFALHDFDPKMCNLLTGYYGFGGLLSGTRWVRDFRGFICSLGLREYDGSAKPAWDVVVKALKEAGQ